ncbi:MAG: GtrA family protein [Clostridium perfringens]|nr:GtrA family protein [Clostridium perfringens]
MDFKKEIHKYIEFIKFNMVGITNFIVDYIIFIILINVFHVNTIIAQGASITAGGFNNFVVNKVWTFRKTKSTRKELMIEFGHFLISDAICTIVSMGGLYLLNNILGINVYIVKFLLGGSVQLFNFVFYKFIIFKKKKA